MHLEYFRIHVRDLDRSLSFYTDVLGLKEVKRGTQYEIGRRICVLLRHEKSDQHFELNWYPSDSPFAIEYSAGEGLDHIGFLVHNLREKFKELLAKGAVPTEVDPAKTGGWVAYVKDPDENSI